MDENGVWSSVFDPEFYVLRLTTVDGPSDDTLVDPFDANGVMAAVYDPDTQSLRVVFVDD